MDFTIENWNYFQRSFDIDKYKDVANFEVLDFEGQLVAVFYADFSKKRKTKWRMTSYKSQAIKNGHQSKRPHVSIVCNFTSTELHLY
jgi:peptidyl-dipeptidase Dcp